MKDIRTIRNRKNEQNKVNIIGSRKEKKVKSGFDFNKNNKKRKKKYLIFFIIAFLIMFLVYLFLFRKDSSDLNNVEVEDGNIEQRVASLSGKQKDEEGNEISFDNLGNFWIEVDTEKLKIKAPIVEGVSQERLDQGVGHHQNTAFPSLEKGNVVLSGHRWMSGDNPARKVFEDLDKLEIGDEFKLNYKGTEFKYKIIETKTVSKDEVSILEQTEEPRVTIYTCTPKFTSLNRLIYVGELVE